MRDPSSSSQSPKGPKQLLKTHLDETADPIADRAKAEGVDPAPHVQLVDGGIAVLATSTQVSGKNPGAVALDEGAAWSVITSLPAPVPFVTHPATRLSNTN